MTKSLRQRTSQWFDQSRARASLLLLLILGAGAASAVGWWAIETYMPLPWRDDLIVKLLQLFLLLWAGATALATALGLIAVLVVIPLLFLRRKLLHKHNELDASHRTTPGSSDEPEARRENGESGE